MWIIPTLPESQEGMQSSVLRNIYIYFRVCNQKFILYINLSYHYCVREMVSPSPLSTFMMPAFLKPVTVENYREHLLKNCPGYVPSTMLGLSHLSSFITHRERDGIIHFLDDETQARYK